jgi:hypothetical protein
LVGGCPLTGAAPGKQQQQQQLPAMDKVEDPKEKELTKLINHDHIYVNSRPIQVIFLS